MALVHTQIENTVFEEGGVVQFTVTLSIRARQRNRAKTQQSKGQSRDII